MRLSTRFRIMRAMAAAVVLALAPSLLSATSGSRSSFLQSVAEGKIPGHSLIRKFGFNPAIVAAEEVIWETGGAYTDTTTAAVVTITHGATDEAAGTGARTIWLDGLAADWSVLIEEVTLGAAGTTNSTGLFVRVNKAWVGDCGTYLQRYASPFGTNNLDVVGAIGANTVFTIGAGRGRTRKSQYAVPLGKTAYLISMSSTVEATLLVRMVLYHRPDADDATPPVTGRQIIHSNVDASESSHSEHFNYIDVFTEKTDIWATASGSASSSEVDYEYQLLLVDN